MNKITLLRLVAVLLLIHSFENIFSQTAVLSRGPYLQMGNQTEITIRWRTAVASNSKVEVGKIYGTYPIVINDASNTTEHIVRVSGLSPDTKYYYRIGSANEVLQGDENNFFTTVPPLSTTRKVRIAVFGDCGRSNAAFQDENLVNYRNYLNENEVDAPDAWLLLGDNAYSSGTDFQYTRGFFNIYGSNILKNHKLYPTLGNHDYGNDELKKSSRSISYFSNFSTPQKGECGGVASYKPNYYSFDIGNIHFLSLDSWGLEGDSTEMGTEGNSSIKSWVIADLEANKSKWVIAYWHHPPYTKGTHNSDTESELIAIRKNFIDVLESRGVDMIITGHSHNYERSFLMKNFRGNWNTFDPAAHAVSTSSATYSSSSTCPYVYNSLPLNHGTVYVVAGSTGATGTVKSNFGSYGLPYAVNDGGVFYLEVEGNRLDAKMLRRDGSIFDKFTILKDAEKRHAMKILNGTTAVLEASWPSADNYSWDNGWSTRKLTVAPPPGVSEYIVSDVFGCVSDTFTISAVSALPVEISNYNVTLKNGKVKVDWTTTSETESSHFNVDRSVDGVNFVSIAKKPAAGNSTKPIDYSVTDNQPLTGISYYRIVQFDKDKNSKAYAIKKINNPEGRGFYVKLVANGNNLNISLQAYAADRIRLDIYNLYGQTVGTQIWNVQQGITLVQKQLKQGAYVLRFTNERKESVVHKIVIE